LQSAVCWAQCGRFLRGGTAGAAGLLAMLTWLLGVLFLGAATTNTAESILHLRTAGATRTASEFPDYDEIGDGFCMMDANEYVVGILGVLAQHNSTNAAECADHCSALVTCDSFTMVQGVDPGLVPSCTLYSGMSGEVSATSISAISTSTKCYVKIYGPLVLDSGGIELPTCGKGVGRISAKPFPPPGSHGHVRHPLGAMAMHAALKAMAAGDPPSSLPLPVCCPPAQTSAA
ncbi:hypothetical protein CYMTET_27987, partial [Cymbomonas tetramitiformis]